MRFLDRKKEKIKTEYTKDKREMKRRRKGGEKKWGTDEMTDGNGREGKETYST